jgi:hypothetical protein
MEVTQATPAPFRFTGKVLASFVVRFAILLVALAGVLFLSAGRVDIWQFWAYIAVTFLGMAYNVSVIVRTDASLLAERVKPGPGGKDRTCASSPWWRFWGCGLSPGWTWGASSGRRPCLTR